MPSGWNSTLATSTRPPASWSRRRLASRIVPLVIVTCVAVLTAGLVCPLTTSGEAIPSVRVDDGTVRLTAYPAVISKPPFIHETRTPGITAAVADRLIQWKRTLEKLPDLIDRVDTYFPAPGGAPPELPELQVDVKQLPRPAWRDLLFAVVGAGVGAAALYFFG